MSKHYVLFNDNAYAIPCNNWRESLKQQMELNKLGHRCSVIHDEELRHLYPRPVIVDYAMASILSLDNGGFVNQRTREMPEIAI